MPDHCISAEVSSSRALPETGSNRVIRGGSWNNNARNARSANRNNWRPDNRNNNVGFRVLSTWYCQRTPFTGCVRVHKDHVQGSVLCRLRPAK
ncbi:MAG: SUMF1/EgtB/PvdO family nonheme iron enzyme [Bacteroidota bacterium]